MGITAGRPIIRFIFDDMTVEAALKDMSRETMSRIPPGSLATQQKLHSRREICLRSTKKQVKVVRHQDRREHLPTVFLDGLANSLKKSVSVHIVDDNCLSAVSPTRDVIYGTRKLDA